MPESAQQLHPADPYQGLSTTLKAAGDPLRLEILRVLARDSYGVLELCSIFEIKQSAMSHHLKVLANAGLVATRREGNSIYYRRSQPVATADHAGLQNSLFHTLDQTLLSETTQQQIDLVQQERAAASQEFFAANAHKFREQQDLIASYTVYADHVSDLLNRIKLKAADTALEVGPGEGEFLPVLSKKFKNVIALDNSLNMLNRAKTFSESEQLQNVEFILGDSQTAVSQNLRADCVIINMVLHHVPSPERIFHDVGLLLNEGGTLIVTDLCRHDQQWATESCGDLWLGFEPRDFTEWADDAGLTEEQSQFFALRNGFQIQLRHFYKRA